MKRICIAILILCIIRIPLSAQVHEVHNDEKHHTELNFDKGETVTERPDRTDKPGKDQKDFPDSHQGSRTIANSSTPQNVSQISLDGAQRLKRLSEFMQMLATIQTLRLLKEFLEYPSLGTFDKLNKIANNDIKEMLEQLAKMPQQQRDIATRIVDDIKNELSLSMDQPPVSGDKNKRDQMFREYEFWNKFEQGLNYVQAKSLQTSLMVTTSPDFGVVSSSSPNNSRVTTLTGPLRMRIKESGTEGFQALSPDMVNISDILIYPIFTITNVPCWGVDVTVNLYTSVYEHDDEDQSTTPIPFDDLESKEDFELLGRYKVPGLSIPHSQFLLTKNSGLFLPDFFYKGYSPSSFYITVDNEDFEDNEGLFDFYFYYTLTIDNLTSAPSSVYKIVHRL
ncbi:MAG: hypothetical protein ACTHJ5_14105 [Ilyomonas sp.]